MRIIPVGNQRKREERKHGLLVLLVLLLAILIMPLHTALATLPIMGVGMIVDAALMFSDAQALVATGNSTNILDFGTERRIGTGEPMALVIGVLAIDATSADETYTVTVQTDDNSGFASPVTLGEIINIPRASAVGSKFVRAIIPGVATERFMRLVYTLGGTTPAITVDAYIEPMVSVQNEAVYPKNFVISV